MLLKIVLILGCVLGFYFACRYISLLYGLREAERELREIRKDMAQNRSLHLAMPNGQLAELLQTVNETLEEIRGERLKYEKREQAFQKQIENISHDLRTPLTVILGYLKLMRQSEGKREQEASVSGSAGLGDQELAEVLQILEQKAETMKALVTQFYDFSRLNAGDYDLTLERQDVSRLLRESLMGNYQVLEQSQLTVTAELPEHPVWVTGDETALERIFLNLLQNAGRYAHSYLRIRVQADPEWVQVCFCNDSMLLTEADLPYLFERFYMQDGARNQGGTGLGLTVARSLAEEMGGDLTVEGEAQEGAFAICFYLRLRALN